MRVSYRTHPGRWMLWDCERMCVPRGARWVDTSTATWGELCIVQSQVAEIVRQERRIDVYFDSMTILFNQFELPEVTSVINAISRPTELTPA